MSLEKPYFQYTSVPTLIRIFEEIPDDLTDQWLEERSNRHRENDNIEVWGFLHRTFTNEALNKNREGIGRDDYRQPVYDYYSKNGYFDFEEEGDEPDCPTNFAIFGLWKKITDMQ